MARREELIRSIIAGLPNNPKPHGELTPLRTDVVQLALNAQKESSLRQQEFAIQSVDRRSGRESTPIFEIITEQECSLSHILKHLVDFTNTMNLSDKTTMRECADIFEAGKWEHEALYSYMVHPDQKEIADEKIVLVDAEHFEYGGYTFDAPVLYHAKKDQKKVTIEPTDMTLGNYSATQVLEAYLLYVLSEK